MFLWRRLVKVNVFSMYGTILATNDGGTDFISNTIKPVNDVNIYPNPTTDKIIISDLKPFDKESTVAIYSLTGNLVKQYTMRNKPQIQIDVSDLSKGMYLVKIQSSNGIEVKNIVMQ